VRSGKISVGDKLFVSSAEKGGPEMPAPPLEAYSTTWLCIGANGTRRAPWDARLGRLRHAPLTPLRNVRLGAGSVPACAVTISRVFPLVYMEITDVEDAHGEVTTTKTIRSAAAEAAYAAAFDARAETVRDGATALAVDKAQRELDARLHGPATHAADDPQQQRAAAAEQEALATKVKFAVQSAMEEARVMPRNVTPMLKLRVVGCGPPGSEQFGEAIITGVALCACFASCSLLSASSFRPTVWRPDEETMNTLREGTTFVVSNLGAREPQRSAGADRMPAAASATGAAVPPRGMGREGALLELSAARSRWLKARPGYGALHGLVSGYIPRLCVPLAALGAARPADFDMRVAEARREAAVAAASRGAGAEACTALANEAGAAAAAPYIANDSYFDAVGILLHAAPVKYGGVRSQQQYGFFVDASLVHAATGAEADPGVLDLVAVKVRCHVFLCARSALTCSPQLKCSHEGGFQPWPADTPAVFPVIVLQHAKFMRHDVANGVRDAEAAEVAEWAIAPKLSCAKTRCAHLAQTCNVVDSLTRVSRSVGAGLADAALQAAKWAEASVPLLTALRVSISCLPIVAVRMRTYMPDAGARHCADRFTETGACSGAQAARRGVCVQHRAATSGDIRHAWHAATGACARCFACASRVQPEGRLVCGGV
jgi:hypothetical protein